MDVLKRSAKSGTDTNDTPVQPVVIESARVVSREAADMAKTGETGFVAFSTGFLMISPVPGRLEAYKKRLPFPGKWVGTEVAKRGGL